MLVQDPEKVSNVDSIFNQAKELGAVERPIDNLGPSSSSRSFTGTARLLSGETVQPAPQQPEAVVHNIIFWSNGFTVNDGPLRRMDDPDNALFLEEPERRQVPFQGVGRSLGGSSSTAAPGQVVNLTVSAASTSSVGLVVDETKPKTSVHLRLADGSRIVAIVAIQSMISVLSLIHLGLKVLEIISCS